jgi:hypothetical protein
MDLKRPAFGDERVWDWGRHVCLHARLVGGRPPLCRASESAAVGPDVSAETRIVGSSSTPTQSGSRPATAAQLVRRVMLIERQRDQSESAAVSGARTSQRPVPRLLVVAAVTAVSDVSGLDAPKLRDPGYPSANRLTLPPSAA